MKYTKLLLFLLVALISNTLSLKTLKRLKIKRRRRIVGYLDWKSKVANEFKKKNPEYTIFPGKLGEGSFGYVYKARVNHKDVAVKFICGSTDRRPRRVKPEVEKEFNEEVESTEHAANSSNFSLPICEKGEFTFDGYKTFYTTSPLAKSDFQAFVRNASISGPRNYRQFTQKQKEIIIQLVVAMDDMHTKSRLVHRDIKPDNILVMEDNRLMIADYGMALKIGHYDYRMGGTPGFIPPDYKTDFQGNLTHQYDFSENVDVFAFGITLAQYLFPDFKRRYPYIFKEYRNLTVRKIEIYYDQVNEFKQHVLREFASKYLQFEINVTHLIFEGMIAPYEDRLSSFEVKNELRSFDQVTFDSVLNKYDFKEDYCSSNHHQHVQDSLPVQHMMGQPMQGQVRQHTQYNQFAQPIQYQYAQPIQYQHAQPKQYQHAQPKQHQFAQPIQHRHPKPKQYQHAQPKQHQFAQPIQYQHAQPKQHQFAQPIQYQHAHPKQHRHPKPKQYQHAQPKQHRHPKPKQHRHPKPKQYQHAQPKQHRQPKPKQYGHAHPKQHRHPKPKQHQFAQPKQYQHPKPKQHRHAQPKQYQHPKPKQHEFHKAKKDNNLLPHFNKTNANLPKPTKNIASNDVNKTIFDFVGREYNPLTKKFEKTYMHKYYKP